MSTPNIHIDSEALRTLVAQAIVNGIEPEQQALLIQGALEHLLTIPKKQNSWDPAPWSPLEKAFQTAVESVALTYAHNAMKEGSFVVRLSEAFDATTQAMIEQSGSLRMRVSDAVGEAVKTWLRDPENRW